MTQNDSARSVHYRKIEREESLRGKRDQRIARVCRRASEAFEKGNFKRGMGVFSKAIARDPGRSATICAAEIQRLVDNGQKALARKVFENRARAGRVSPPMADSILEAYQKLAGPESYAKALRLIDIIEASGVSLFCLSQKSMELVVRVMYDRRKYERIEKLLGKASEFGALNEKMRLELLEAKRKLKKYDDVIGAVNGFLDGRVADFGDPTYLQARLIRAYALSGSGRLSEALAEFDVLVEQVPENSPFRCRILCGWIFTKKDFGDFIDSAQQERVDVELMKYAGGLNRDRAEKTRAALRDLWNLSTIETVQASTEQDYFAAAVA